MPEITLKVDDADYALLQDAADGEMRTLEAFILWVAKLKAKKRLSILKAREHRHRERAELVEA
jgi:uncharacterized protein (DUF1778 family)